MKVSKSKRFDPEIGKKLTENSQSIDSRIYNQNEMFTTNVEGIADSTVSDKVILNENLDFSLSDTMMPFENKRKFDPSFASQDDFPPVNNYWRYHFEALLEYYKKYGNCELSTDATYECQLNSNLCYRGKLGKWLEIQRLKMIANELKNSRKNLLMVIVNAGELHDFLFTI